MGCGVSKKPEQKLDKVVPESEPVPPVVEPEVPVSKYEGPLVVLKILSPLAPTKFVPGSLVTVRWAVEFPDPQNMPFIESLTLALVTRQVAQTAAVILEEQEEQKDDGKQAMKPVPEALFVYDQISVLREDISTGLSEIEISLPRTLPKNAPTVCLHLRAMMGGDAAAETDEASHSKAAAVAVPEKAEEEDAPDPVAEGESVDGKEHSAAVVYEVYSEAFPVTKAVRHKRYSIKARGAAQKRATLKIKAAAKLMMRSNTGLTSKKVAPFG